MDPVTKILYHNYTIAVCNHLYPKFVKLEDCSFQQYEEAPKKLNREKYQWPMNTNLNVSDQT